MATDYTTECGAVPMSFIQMLASTIRGYRDIAGVTHYRINALEAADDCDETYGPPLDCDTSHIDPERQLVEGVFALDDCGLLALKAFINSTEDPTDYEECGEMPQTFIQMLARCIVTYNSSNKINVVTKTDNCDTLEDLIDCITNNIESERLLVKNLFALDECGYMCLKIFSNSGGVETGTTTDYTTECVDMAQSFYQLLARCIVLYDGQYMLNVLKVSGNCVDLLDFWTCANNHIPPERALVENLFVIDECGHLAIKWFNNQGERQ